MVQASGKHSFRLLSLGGLLLAASSLSIPNSPSPCVEPIGIGRIYPKCRARIGQASFLSTADQQCNDVQRCNFWLDRIGCSTRDKPLLEWMLKENAPCPIPKSTRCSNILCSEILLIEWTWWLGTSWSNSACQAGKEAKRLRGLRRWSPSTALQVFVSIHVAATTQTQWE